MSGMRRDDIIWTMVITLIAVTINPILKSIGLLPADVFRSLGIFYPGLPQIVFGPLMAFLLLLLFLKTGKPLVFPVIGFLRALSLSFVFPANLEHSGTLLAAIVAGGVAAVLLNNTERTRSGMWLPALAGLYAVCMPPATISPVSYSARQRRTRWSSTLLSRRLAWWSAALCWGPCSVCSHVD